MLQLFIDTSTERSLVGLARDADLLDSVELPFGTHNSKLLFPEIMRLFAKHQLSIKDLQLIGCGIGPGSYTGIRVGAAAAQAMSFALHIPLVGFSSLDGFFPGAPGNFAVLIDARIGGVYLSKGSFDGKRATMRSEPSVCSLQDLSAELENINTLVSPHAEQLRNKLDLSLQSKHWEESPPSGKGIAALVYQRYLNGEYSKQSELKLLYLRKTQAEIERELHTKSLAEGDVLP